VQNFAGTGFETLHFNERSLGRNRSDLSPICRRATSSAQPTVNVHPLRVQSCQDDLKQQRLAATCSEPSKSTRNERPCTPPAVVRAGTELFCFMAVLPGSFEEELRRSAERKGTGIFACDVSRVYQSYWVGRTSAGWSANIPVFKKIWSQVWEDGIYRTKDWTVKADPDTVWSPQRLRWRLPRYEVNEGDMYFIKNYGGGILGPIEILTKSAVDRLSEVMVEQCNYNSQGGEDDWLRVCCMQTAGFGYKTDLHLLSFSPPVCGDSSFVAYHPLKNSWAWNACADQMLR